MAAACLAAGKYVYCEKPLGITPEQVNTVLRAAKRSKAFLQIGQQLRYMPGLREVIRHIQEERILGEPFGIKAQRHSTPVRPDAEQARPAWYKDEVLRRPHRGKCRSQPDVCNWVAGSRPESAFGTAKSIFLPIAQAR
jgi:predicted dehydrogenase